MIWFLISRVLRDLGREWGIKDQCYEAPSSQKIISVFRKVENFLKNRLLLTNDAIFSLSSFTWLRGDRHRGTISILKLKPGQSHDFFVRRPKIDLLQDFIKLKILLGGRKLKWRDFILNLNNRFRKTFYGLRNSGWRRQITRKYHEDEKYF